MANSARFQFPPARPCEPIAVPHQLRFVRFALFRIARLHLAATASLTVQLCRSGHSCLDFRSRSSRGTKPERGARLDFVRCSLNKLQSSSSRFPSCDGILSLIERKQLKGASRSQGWYDPCVGLGECDSKNGLKGCTCEVRRDGTSSDSWSTHGPVPISKPRY